MGEGKYFKSVNEAILAYENKATDSADQNQSACDKDHAGRYNKDRYGRVHTGTISLFNEILPQDLGFVDRSIPENELKLEVDFHVGKKQLKQILEKVINTHGATKTAEVLDDIKAMGYKYLHKSSYDRIHFRYDRAA